MRPPWRTVNAKEKWLMLALLFIGLLIRCALYFPPAMFQLDSDAVIAGLCAFRVMEGHYQIFLPGGIRIGAGSCYVMAAYSYVVGANHLALALTGLTWGALYLVFSGLFLHATLGRRLAPIAYLFAVVPSEQFMTVTYAPWGYGEIMAVCAATLWLATVWRNRGTVLVRFFCGFSIGVGIWCSLQTLMITIPAIAWIALKRRRALVGESLIALPGVVMGTLPFLIANVATGFPALTQNSYSQTVSSLSQAVANFIWLMTNVGPKLLFRFPAWPDWLILLVAFAFVVLGLSVALRRGIPDLISENQLKDAIQLVTITVISCVLIFSFSEAGTIRGWTVRYIAPLYVIAPIWYGLGIAGLWRRSRALTVLTVAALLIPNLLAYGLPGSALRSQLTNELADDLRLRDLLSADHVRMVYGDYLWVYHLNFDSQERIAGVPYQEAYDYYRYGDRLGTSSVKWALLGGLDEVLAWSRKVKARGTLSKSGDLWVFISNVPSPNAAALISALRR
jgi:hypothetical protein